MQDVQPRAVGASSAAPADRLRKRLNLGEPPATALVSDDTAADLSEIRPSACVPVWDRARPGTRD
ncbi:hypothetical protein GCM10009811_03460 [Nostocoides veronense]|uniref:Uncharacterized protein n=1 Tax=Nostocoides veronense TaxID=330836 RepID=A0ABN2LAQ1_9MICO